MAVSCANVCQVGISAVVYAHPVLLVKLPADACTAVGLLVVTLVLSLQDTCFG